MICDPLTCVFIIFSTGRIILAFSLSQRVCAWIEITAWPIIQYIKKSDCGVNAQKCCDVGLQCAFLQKVPARCLEGGISLKGAFTKKCNLKRNP